MPHNLPPRKLKAALKLIGNLSRNGMTAGNAGDFDTAFLNLDDALAYARELDKPCLEAKLLNNLGLLHIQSGQWDRALLSFEQSMSMVTEHYGRDNILYRTLQKNLGCALNLDLAAA